MKYILLCILYITYDLRHIHIQSTNLHSDNFPKQRSKNSTFESIIKSCHDNYTRKVQKRERRVKLLGES